MAQPQAQRDLICPLRGNRAWEEFALKKKNPFSFSSQPLMSEIHQLSWALKRQAQMGHVASTWILFRGLNPAPTATCGSFNNAPGPRRFFIPARSDDHSRCHRQNLSVATPNRGRIKVTSKPRHVTGNTASQLRQSFI